MSDDLMLKCLVCFILGYFLCKMMGNGFSVGGMTDDFTYCDDGITQCIPNQCCPTTMIKVNDEDKLMYIRTPCPGSDDDFDDCD